MLNPRPSAWALVFVLVAGLLGSASAPGPVAAVTGECTGWTDNFHPPTEIRVKRGSGPNAGHVEVVPFWNYVGTVLRAEYASGATTGTMWMRLGALTVKQYGWYYAMHWRGGKVTTANEDGSTTVECWDVQDNTNDQIYKPQKLVNGVWVPANVPTPVNLKGMTETWHITLRKYNIKKKYSRLFLTGYRSGKKKPCGADSTGFKIFQKSLRDCTRKLLNFEEVVREYFEPNVEIVDVRTHDVLDDAGKWLGDLGVLKQNGTGTDWRVYAPTFSGGQAGDFAPAVSGDLGIPWANIALNGAVDVNGDDRTDVVVLTTSGKLRVALANGTGYGALSSQDLPAGTPTGTMIVGDFDGDLLGDVGLLRSTPVIPGPGDPATLVVMRGAADGTFGSPQDWWRGALDLSTQLVSPGDTNGDGKADLIIRDASVGLRYWVAPSFASCADFAAVGSCTLVPGVGLDIAALWFDRPEWLPNNYKLTPADFDRDGRTDLVLVSKETTGIKVLALKALKSGGFADPQTLWSNTSLAFSDTMAVGMDVNTDGLADVALLRKDGTNTALRWLRAVVSAGVVTHSAVNELSDAALPWNNGLVRPY
ncbi:MAG: VCBS repeat-containing protein [Chloroflexota bacterium]